MTLYTHVALALDDAAADLAGVKVGTAYVSARDAAIAAALLTEKCRVPVKVASVQPVDSGDYVAGALTRAGLVTHDSAPAHSVIVVGHPNDDGHIRVIRRNTLVAAGIGYLVGTGNRIAYSRTMP